MALGILTKNPYRVLGVSINDARRAQVANKGKIAAHLQVGKQVSFPLDMTGFLPAVPRSAESIAEAEARLTRPEEQLRYAQFWFARSTQQDSLALEHLQAGTPETGVGIWQRASGVSALHNLVVSYLMMERYADAIAAAYRLYSTQGRELLALVFGDAPTVSHQGMDRVFLQVLGDELGASKLLEYVKEPSWRSILTEDAARPLIVSIMGAVKRTEGCDDSRALTEGQRLMKVQVPELKRLEGILGKGDVQYQSTADKLAECILQCAVRYYNDQEDGEAAREAKVLAEKALTIACGEFVRDRCKQNINLLTKIISRLPPPEWEDTFESIESDIEDIEDTSTLSEQHTILTRAGRNVLRIAEALGSTNEALLRVSSNLVVTTTNDTQVHIMSLINALRNGGSPILFLGGLKQALITMNTLKLLPIHSSYRADFTRVYNEIREICTKGGAPYSFSDTLPIKPATKQRYNPPAPTRPTHTPTPQQPTAAAYSSGVASNRYTAPASKPVEKENGCLIAFFLFLIPALLAVLALVFFIIDKL